MESRMVYIGSPYAGNIEENVAFAKQACRYAIRQGSVPLVPHLLYPQILNDSIPEEREIGIRLGLEVLERCDEIWLCGEKMSSGMKREVEYANARDIPVRRVSVQEIVENERSREIGEKPIGQGVKADQPEKNDVQMGM